MLWRSQPLAITRRSGFDPWPLHESLWCTKGSGRGFSPRTLFSPYYCLSPTLHLNTTIVRRTSGRSWEPFNRGVLFHLLGRSTLRLFLAAKCCGQWHRVVNYKCTGVSEEPYCLHCKDITFLADRTAPRRFVLGWLLAHHTPVHRYSFQVAADCWRTDGPVCFCSSLSLTHSLTHALAFLPSPTRSRYTG